VTSVGPYEFVVQMYKLLRVAPAACLLLALLTADSCGDVPDNCSISVQNLKIASEESVVSFEFDVKAGAVESIAKLPMGWQFTIDKEANWSSKVTGRTTLGATSMSSDEFKRLVFTVRRSGSSDNKFDVSGIVSASRSFTNETVALKLGDFNLKAAP
jgi:hypothetical protein